MTESFSIISKTPYIFAIYYEMKLWVNRRHGCSVYHHMINKWMHEASHVTDTIPPPVWLGMGISMWFSHHILEYNKMISCKATNVIYRKWYNYLLHSETLSSYIFTNRTLIAVCKIVGIIAIVVLAVQINPSFIKVLFLVYANKKYRLLYWCEVMLQYWIKISNQKGKVRRLLWTAFLKV